MINVLVVALQYEMTNTVKANCKATVRKLVSVMRVGRSVKILLESLLGTKKQKKFKHGTH